MSFITPFKVGGPPFSCFPKAVIPFDAYGGGPIVVMAQGPAARSQKGETAPAIVTLAMSKGKPR